MYTPRTTKEERDGLANMFRDSFGLALATLACRSLDDLTAAEAEITTLREQLAEYQSADELREETWARALRTTDADCEKLYGWLQETGGKTSLIISLELMRARKAEERLTLEVEEYEGLMELRRKAERDQELTDQMTGCMHQGQTKRK